MQLMTENKYFTLCSEMIQDYQLLRIKLDEHKSQGRTAYLIAGPTGYGKSTFLARLKSNESPEEFMTSINNIITSPRNHVIHQGVAIAGKQGSTTVVSNFFEVKDKLIVDMPGFIDTNKDMAPVISVLNFNLFANVAKGKFIIVFNAQQLASPGIFNTTMGVYTKEFISMFTPNNLDTCMGSMIFVMTRVDNVIADLERIAIEKGLEALIPSFQSPDRVKRIKALKLIIGTAIQDYGMRAGSDDISRIVRIMYQNFMVADYRYDTSTDVLAEIDEMFRGKHSVECSEIRFDTVSDTNELCNKARSVVEELGRETHKQKTILSEVFQKSREIEDNLRQRVRDSNSQLQSTKEAIESNKTEATALKKEREILTEAQSREPIELKERESDLKTAEGNLARARDALTDLTLIHLDVLLSTKSTSKFGRDYTLKTKVRKPQNTILEASVMLMSVDEYERKMKDILSCRTRLELKKLKILKTDEAETLIEIKDTEMDVDIRVSSKFPVVVIVACDVPISQTTHIDPFLAYSEDMIRTSKQRIDSLRESIRRRVEKLAEIKARLTELEINRPRLENALSTLSTAARLYRNSVRESFEMLKTQLGNIQITIEQLHKNETFLKTKEIAHILIRSRVEVDTFGKIPAIIQSGLEIVQETIERRQELDRLCEEIVDSVLFYE